MPDDAKPPYPMSKEQRRKWLDSRTPEQLATLRAAHEKTREPWDPKRRQNRMITAYRKQRDYIVQDMHRGASLQVAAKRYEDYGLLVAMLIDDGLLVLKAGNETVPVTSRLAGGASVAAR